MEGKSIIAVRNLHKTFRLPHERYPGAKQFFVNFFNRKRGFEEQQVINNVSFEIRKGEFFGIVGRNGSGKSTLLKLLAGIYTPDSGDVQINGSLTPFIELGVGFNPELTGRENIYMNGALLGFSRKEMEEMYDEIVTFAELEKFMDQKLKNYSSGMQVRLAFSIAIRARADILLIDEVLAVGDLDFQKKCRNYFFDLKKTGKTVIIVTHDMLAVRTFCTRVAMLSSGELIKIGSPEEIASLYEEESQRAAAPRLEEEQQDKQAALKSITKRDGTGEATIERAMTFSPKTGEKQNVFNSKDVIGVRLEFLAHSDLPAPALGFIFQDEQDVTVFATNTMKQKIITRPIKKGEKVIFETVIDNVFTDGEFTVTAAIESNDFRFVYDRVKYLHKFIIGGHPLPHAKTHPKHEMTISYR